MSELQPCLPTDLMVQSAVSGQESEMRFVARQPILDRDERVFGYELLFRSGVQNWFSSADPNAASRSTIDCSLLMGTGSLTDGKRAFVNFTRDLILDGTATVLPRDLAVVEILEDVPDDCEVLSALRELKRAGYVLALDDFTGASDRARFEPLADIIKVDFAQTNRAAQCRIAARNRGAYLLAEKIETRDDFDSAVRMGYSYFQGYFFCKPVMIAAHDLPALHLHCLKVLQAVSDPDFRVETVESAIKEEPALCFRLLRYLNSVALGLYPVRSIRHALALIGQRDLQKWVSIATAVALAGQRSSELITTALTRARFCELIADDLKLNASDLFLTGMFSLIDAILNQPLSNILAELPLSRDAKSALLEHSGTFADVLSLSIAFERANWEQISKLSTSLKLSESDAHTRHTDSISWVRRIVAESRLDALPGGGGQ